jgi:hypothetical protein
MVLDKKYVFFLPKTSQNPKHSTQKHHFLTKNPPITPIFTSKTPFSHRKHHFLIKKTPFSHLKHLKNTIPILNTLKNPKFHLKNAPKSQFSPQKPLKSPIKPSKTPQKKPPRTPPSSWPSRASPPTPALCTAGRSRRTRRARRGSLHWGRR